MYPMFRMQYAQMWQMIIDFQHSNQQLKEQLQTLFDEGKGIASKEGTTNFTRISKNLLAQLFKFDGPPNLHEDMQNHSIGGYDGHIIGSFFYYSWSFLKSFLCLSY